MRANYNVLSSMSSKIQHLAIRPPLTKMMALKKMWMQTLCIYNPQIWSMIIEMQDYLIISLHSSKFKCIINIRKKFKKFFHLGKSKVFENLCVWSDNNYLILLSKLWYIIIQGRATRVSQGQVYLIHEDTCTPITILNWVMWIYRWQNLFQKHTLPIVPPQS